MLPQVSASETARAEREVRKGMGWSGRARMKGSLRGFVGIDTHYYAWL